MDKVIYIIQRLKQIPADILAVRIGPPSSPPITILLTVSTVKHIIEVIRKSITENPRVPDGTIEGL